MIKIIKESILDNQSEYICHACNCITDYSKGLAKSIFDKYPYSDIYKNRNQQDIPGKIIVCGDGISQRYVVNMLTQIYAGKPKFDNGNDSDKAREKYFYDCLKMLSKVSTAKSVAFPSRIGCGLGGGDWSNYLKLIELYESYVFKKYNCEVVICEY